jgi:hypothetical protein
VGTSIGIALIALFLVSSVVMIWNLRDEPEGVSAAEIRHAA